MKLAVELVKADDRIHSKEVTVLDEVQSALGLEQNELDLIHYLFLENAVGCLKDLDEKSIRPVIDLFNEIMCSDNDIDFEENLLLSSISMSCDDGSKDWCSILSVNATETEAPERQIVFLESGFSRPAHQVLDDKYENLLIVQTTSKSRSLAGMRIGYALGSETLISTLEAVKNSYNSYTMDAIALAVGEASIRDEDYFQQTCRKVSTTRDRSAEALRALGFTVLPSLTNFLFVTHPNKKAPDIFAALREKGIFIRYFKLPRIDNYLRITVGTDEQMDKLIAALKEIL